MAENGKCIAMTASGEPCQAFSMENSSFCHAHNPSTKASFRAAQLKGARHGGRARTAKSIARAMGLSDLEHIDLRTPEGFVAFLEDLARAAVDELDMTASNLNALVKLVQAVADARHLPEIQDTLERLEERIHG